MENKKNVAAAEGRVVTEFGNKQKGNNNNNSKVAPSKDSRFTIWSGPSDLDAKIDKICASIDRFISRVGRTLITMMIAALVLNVIAEYFWPELPQKIPVIFEYCNGFLTLGEFLVRAALGLVASLFNGNFAEFWSTYTAEFNELLAQFWAWMSAIKF